MKSILFLALLTLSQFANAESIPNSRRVASSETYSHALFDGQTCDLNRIPDAAKAAVDEAFNQARKACANPKILAARILRIEPTACRSWNAGFRARAEVEFSCPTLTDPSDESL